MVLDYVALVMLIAVLALVVYGVVAVWGIPHEIAKARRHPHEDAIGVATWVSLFTVGVLWPLLWIWAMIWRPDRGWGLAGAPRADQARVADLERRLAALERSGPR